MVIRTIPKSATFREVSAKFIFEYQTSGVYAGQYACLSPDDKITLMDTEKNTVFLADNISVACSLPENTFVESLQTTQFPAIRFRRIVRNEPLSAQPIILSQYYQEKSISHYFDCNKENDGLVVQVIGRFNQVPYTIGLDQIDLSLSIGVYEIDENEANKFFRDKDY